VCVGVVMLSLLLEALVVVFLTTGPVTGEGRGGEVGWGKKTRGGVACQRKELVCLSVCVAYEQNMSRMLFKERGTCTTNQCQWLYACSGY